MGLLTSCLARSVDQAAGLIPLLLMPQLLLAGALIPLAQMPTVIRALAQIALARWSYAGIGSAAALGGRLASTGAGGALGFAPDFFSITPATAAVALVAFIVALMIAALLALARRPEPQR
jgi:ABC-type multidrug transport system permease subunit